MHIDQNGGDETQAFTKDNAKTRAKIVSLKPEHNQRRRFQAWIKKKFYILSWIPKYNTNFAVSDLIAGITLGLTAIPESIACAALAGLPTVYGLYSSFIGPLIYILFGTIPKVLIGPTSLLALLTVQFTMNKPIEFVFVMTFLAGVLEMIMGVLHLGFVFDFISMTVIAAFSSAVAILIVESQIKTVLGIQYLVPGFINSIQTLIYKIEEARLGDGMVGLASIVFLVALSFMPKIPVKTVSRLGRFVKGFIDYTSLARNALLVVFAGIVTYSWVMTSTEPLPFRMSKEIEAGLPTFMFPSFYVEANNRTYNFVEIVQDVGIGVLVIPIVSILVNVSIDKALSPKGLVDISQELVTLGLCNMIGSTAQSMPTCGAFTRAGISSISGIKTSMAGLYSSVVVILALSLLTPYFTYIPQATLAAILIVAIIPIINPRLPVQLFKKSKGDLVVWCLVFFACIIFGVEIGLFIGIIVNCAHLLVIWARPNIDVKIEELDDVQYISITPHNGLYFPGIDYLRQKTMKACMTTEFGVPVVINCRKIVGLDFTASQGLHKLASEMDSGTKLQLLVLYDMDLKFQQMIESAPNIAYCNDEDSLAEILTQHSLRSGSVCLLPHVRRSVDLGYNVKPIDV